jgi:hypothetical protein
MKKIAIKNFSELAVSKEREIILNLAETGYAAIFKSQVHTWNHFLCIVSSCSALFIKKV